MALASPAGAVNVFSIDRAFAPPLFAVGGKTIAILDNGDAITVGVSSRRVAARGLTPGTVLVEGDRLYAGGPREASAWRCKARRSGAVACSANWRQTLGGAVTASPVFAGDQVLVGAWDTFVYSFGARNGHLHWRTRAGLRLATPLLPWGELVAAAAEGAPLVQFFRADDGAAVGRIAGRDDEIFIGGIARAGDLLLALTLPYPTLQPSLRAYRVQISAGKPKA